MKAGRAITIAAVCAVLLSPAAASAQQPPAGREEERSANERALGAVFGVPSWLGLRMVLQGEQYGLILETTSVTIDRASGPEGRATLRIALRRLLARSDRYLGYAFVGGSSLDGTLKDVPGNYYSVEAGVGGEVRWDLVGIGVEVGTFYPIWKPAAFGGVDLIAELNLHLWF